MNNDNTMQTVKPTVKPVSVRIENSMFFLKFLKEDFRLYNNMLISFSF